MRRLFVPTFGPSDWRRLLADSEKQWRRTKSAYESAVAWEAARHRDRGIPPEVAAVLDSDTSFSGCRLLLGIPEHQVTLAGGGHASQTDFWALLDAPVGVTSMAVEAKAGESFDKLVADWLAGASRKSGKPDRLRQLCSKLGLAETQAQGCRYQLLHRPVSAILEAERFHLDAAVFLVHAFGDNARSWRDYATWLDLLGVSASPGRMMRVSIPGETSFWTGWVDATPAEPSTIAAAV